MAKKRSASQQRKTPAVRKKSSRRSKKTFDWRRILLALGVLLVLVVAGAVTVRLLLPPPPMPVAVKVPPQPPARVLPPPKPSPPAQVAPAPTAKPAPPPTYEVFPPVETPPPQAPPVALPPVLPGKPRVALVIDDLGYDLRLAEAFLDLDVPLTLAVLPFSPHQSEVVAAARRRGHQVMLHLPMEPEEYPHVDPGPGALLARMSPDELIAQLRRDLAQVPEAVGVNNHMGSRLTRESVQLNQIFSVLKERGLFFIDSRTTSLSLGYQSARLLKVPFAQRDVFLDHRQEPDFVRGQVKELLRRAEKSGQALGIGHPHQVTLEVLREMLPEIRRRVELVPAATLVRTLS
ncbi:MAG: divergent polysaccharide deacetylase family protein [Desulfobacteraceae bacterium]|jgi:polysaccharide deacetylase 2 family uncharacterized protein YibQ|nr:divergent polysaccharide deacetylase family protein [Desulfobacteraceae bacterium]